MELTAQIRGEILDMHNDGVRTTDIAEVYGCRRSRVRQALYDQGVVSVRMPPKDWWERAQDMRPYEAVEYLRDIIEEFIPGLSGDHHATDNWGLTLTGRERTVLRCLYDRSPYLATKDMLLSAISVGKSAEEVPGKRVIDVYVYHLRKKVPSSKAKIVTRRGRGYALELAQ